MMNLRAFFVAPALFAVLACSSSSSGGSGVVDGGGGQSSSTAGTANSGDGDVSNPSGGSGGNEGPDGGGDLSGDGDVPDAGNAMDDMDGGDAATAEISNLDLFQQAVDGNPDEFTELVRLRIEETLLPWELDYLTQIDWAAEDALLDDPVFFRAVQALNYVAELNSDPYTQALLVCDDPAAESNRRRYRQNCTGIEPIFFMVSPTNPKGLVIAAAVTYVGRSTADEEGLSLQESSNKFVTCNTAGSHLNDELRRLLDPCLQDTDCVQVTDSVTGTHCNSETSLDLDYENTCEFAIAVRYCLWSLTSNDWDCGTESAIGAGAMAGGGAWTCNSSGEYVLQAMSQENYMSSTCTFETPDPL
jgi:hypothetical protein